MKKCTLLVGAMAVAAMSGAASASTYSFDFAPGDPGSYGINNNGGQFERVQSTFNSSTNQLTFKVTFSNQVTKGFTLAINNGTNPKGHGGEMGLFYFDASNLSSPKITTYTYNGLNTTTSWKDGDGTVGGNQTPDLIVTDANRSGSASVQDVGGKRILSFSMDV